MSFGLHDVDVWDIFLNHCSCRKIHYAKLDQRHGSGGG
jgi:hypothetical protein